MLLMLNEVTRIPQVAGFFPDNPIWQFLAFHTEHVEWRGCSLHDMIQPSFSFLVGAALAFSLSKRQQLQSRAEMWIHAAWRALALIMLGVLLRSLGRGYINWTFEDTLTQIGLGYLPLFWIAQRGPRLQKGMYVTLLVAYAGAFVAYPAGGYGAGVPADWPHQMSGWAAHWNKNANLAWAFDTWFLNLFPRPKPFLFNGGGYATLSFIPTLATMLMGLFAGQWMRRDAKDLRPFWIWGLAALATGLVLDAALLLPSVKRIWTPSWVLVSGGVCLLTTAVIHWLTDIQGWRKWAFPLVVIGANSIFIYVLSHIIEGPWIRALRDMGWDGGAAQILSRGMFVLACYWVFLYVMYRRKWLIRI